MTILLAIDDYHIKTDGGACFIVRRLAEKLSKKNKVVILTSHRFGPEKITNTNNITTHSIPINYPERFRAYLSIYNPQINTRLKEILNKYKPNVVHAHTIHTYITYHFLKLAKQSGANVIFTGHDVMPTFYGRLTQFIDKDNDGVLDTLDNKVNFFTQAWRNKLHFNPIRNPLARYYLNQIKTITVSQALKDVYTINGINVHSIVNNGIDVKDWQIPSSTIRNFKTKHKLNHKTVMFYSGRLRKDKGSLQSVKLLVKIPNTVLLIAGKESGLGEMKKLAKHLNVADRLIYIGFLTQTEMKTAYHSSDVILVPSICFDSFPNAVIEGMACGKLVIATQYGGSKEAIEDGKSGIIINPFDIEKFASKVTSILNNKQKMEKMGENAKSRVEKEFSIDNQIEKYRSIYLS